MLLEQLQVQKDFTPSEKAIADYIIHDAASIGALSTSELAQATHTSKATVTRLCQKLGIPSYREFQRQIEKEQAISHDLNLMLDEMPITRDTNYDDVLRILPAFYENSIYDTSLRLNKQTVLKVVQRIRTAQKIELYGSGVTHSIAQLAAFKLATLGIDCSVLSGLNEHSILADRHPKEKVVIMLSMTGGNETMIHVAQWLKKRNYYIVGIGGDVRHDLEALCNDYITVPTEQNILGMEIIKAFNAINYVVDILFALLLAKDYDYNREVALRLLSGED